MIRRRPSPRRRSLFVIPAFLGCMALAAFAFAGLEANARWAHDGTNTYGLGRAAARWAERHVRTNRLGVRDDVEYEPELAADRRRVAFLGGGYTSGQGVADVDRRFANLLRAQDADRDVHILAMPGLNTVEQLAMVRRLAASRYTLDLLVLVYHLDDVLGVDEQRFGVLGQLYGGHLDEPWLTRKSYFVNTRHYESRARSGLAARSRLDRIASAYRGAEWASERRLLVELEEIVVGHGGELAIVTFPLLHTLTRSRGYAFDAAHEAVAQHCRERGINHLDLRATFATEDPDTLVVSDVDGHPSERAHAMAAAAIAPFLDELLSSP